MDCSTKAIALLRKIIDAKLTKAELNQVFGKAQEIIKRRQTNTK